MSLLAQLQAEVREVNELNGWFDTERPFSADIALLHSEVSELYEGLLNNDATNVAEEFADILIRLLDTAERQGWDLEGDGRFAWPPPSDILAPTTSNTAAVLHKRISDIYEAYRNNGDIEAAARGFLASLSGLVERHSVDLEYAVARKLERNRQRGYRHGGKVE